MIHLFLRLLSCFSPFLVPPCSRAFLLHFWGYPTEIRQNLDFSRFISGGFPMQKRPKNHDFRAGRIIGGKIFICRFP